jgi:hydroxypyruvate reductase
VLEYLRHHPMKSPCSMIAIGKAAAAMALGAQRALGETLRAGLVITRPGHTEPRLDGGRVLQLEGAHPLPDARSLAAGDSLLEFLDSLPDEEPLLFLLSGGASALVEVLPPGVSAAQLTAVNHWLLASGLGIAEMNTLRKRLSRIKGGRLIPRLRGRRTLQLLLSDVPGNLLGVIGSGLLIADDAPAPAPLAHDLMPPDGLQGLLATQPHEALEAGNIESHIIATNEGACEALVAAAQRQGITTYHHPGHFQGDAGELAAQFCERLLHGPEGLHLWGGESSVQLPAHPGCGGRNQHLALAAARYLSGHENLLLLAAGSDGSDGATEDAGALVDGGTIQRGEWEGVSAADALQRADAGRFLEASGDLIQTGPTGTNVMDLVLAWKW